MDVTAGNSVVTGRLGTKAWEACDTSAVEDALEPGPTTVRPDRFLEPLLSVWSNEAQPRYSSRHPREDSSECSSERTQNDSSPANPRTDLARLRWLPRPMGCQVMGARHAGTPSGFPGASHTAGTGRESPASVASVQALAVGVRVDNYRSVPLISAVVDDCEDCDGWVYEIRYGCGCEVVSWVR